MTTDPLPLRQTFAGFALVALLAITALATAGGAGPGVLAAGAQVSSAATRPLELSSQTTWVRTGQPFEARVVVRHDRSADLELATTVYRAVGSRSQFDRTLEGTGLGSVVTTTPPVDLADPVAAELGAVLVEIDTANLSLGVHPVVIELREKANRQVVDKLVTFVLRVPDDAGPQPLKVAWVQPLDAPPALQPDGSRVLDAARIGAVNRIVNTLAARPGLSVTVDLTPETAEALTVTDPAAAKRLAAVLAPASVRLLAAPYVDVDASDLVAEGLGADLVGQRRAGEAALREATPSAGDPRLWSSEQPLTPAAIAQLLTMGVTGVVVPEAGLAPLDPALLSRRTLVQPFAMADTDGRLVDAVAADPQLLRHLELGDAVLGAHHLLAELAYLYFDAPGLAKGVVFRPPPGWDAPPAFLAVLGAGLSAGTVVTPVTLDTLIGSVPALEDGDRPVVRELSTEPADRADQGIGREVADRIRSSTIALSVARSLIGAGEQPTALVALETHILVAEATSLSRDQRLAHLETVSRAAERARTGVGLGPSRSYRLTAREGTIPITLRNDNPFPVTVRLELSSDKLEFADADNPGARSRVFTGLVIDARQRLVVTVPVRALSSAAFPLRASVRPDAGSTELATEQYTVVSTAVPGVGIALSVGAGVGLAWWWARHWRRARRLTGSPESASTTDADHDAR